MTTQLILKMLSVRHTWAQLIIDGEPIKNIENRTWPTRYRGPVLIHASLKHSTTSPDMPGRMGTLNYGGVIGIVRLVDCVTCSTSRWFEGPFGFVLSDPKPLAFVPWRGALSLIDVPQELVQRIGERHLREYLTP